jgi:hypothetical protein
MEALAEQKSMGKGTYSPEYLARWAHPKIVDGEMYDTQV